MWKLKVLSMMANERDRTALLPHLLTFFLVALLSLLSWSTKVARVPDGVDSLGDQIAAATALKLRAKEPIFIAAVELSPLERALFWSEVVFLASTGEGDRADLYRAEVRRAPGGRLLALRGLKNLTASPAGDEFQLVVRPPFAVVAARSLGQVRSLSIFDFRGHSFPDGGEWSPVARFLARITDAYKTGHLSGVGKTTIRFLHPPVNVALNFKNDGGSPERPRLLTRFADARDRIQDAVLTFGRDREQGVSSDHPELLVNREVRLPKHLILWLVDTVRSLPWIGPGPIEWAEGRFFSLQDAFRRARFGVFGEELAEGDDVNSAESEEKALAFELPHGLEVGRVVPEPVWPPPKLKPPVFSRLAPGEGVWKAAAPEFIRKLPEAPPAFYRTYTRPDGQRPYVKVELIAFDMRQLELHMVAGHEDPQPTTGSLGTGRIPRRPKILSNVVAAFNGAFKTEHGAYGMMVEDDVLLPPVDEAATVASLEDGTTLMGSWPKGLAIPSKMRSFRQNMDPLLERGVVNPRRRYLWGFTLDEDIRNMNTIRSGICAADAGYVVYAWGEDLTAQTLGVAMNAAGCSYGMHLDMNPLHTAFFYYRFDDQMNLKKPKFKAQMAIKEMRYSEFRYVNGAPKDFFFLTLRDASPGPGWEAMNLAQPAPAFVPAVYKKREGHSEFLAVDMTRASAEIFPGEVPLELAPAASGQDGEKPAHEKVLVDIPLGRWSHSRGQLVGSAVVATMVEDRGTLGIDEAGQVLIDLWPLAGTGRLIGDAVQADWLIPSGKDPAGDRFVVALGFTKHNWLLIGQGPAEEVAGLMKQWGVAKALAFDLPEQQEGVAVRTSAAMANLAGASIRARSKNVATLRLEAAPRFLGAGRLENWAESAAASPEAPEANALPGE